MGEALGQDFPVTVSTPLMAGLAQTEFIRLFLDQVKSHSLLFYNVVASLTRGLSVALCVFVCLCIDLHGGGHCVVLPWRIADLFTAIGRCRGKDL